MSPGLVGGWGSYSWPPSLVDGTSEAPRLVLGAVESEPWEEQTPGEQGAEPPLGLVAGSEGAGGPFTRSNGCEFPECDESGELLTKGLYSSENAALNRKRRLFSVRCHRGIACGIAKGKRFRVFCLTESDEALRVELPFGRVLNKFWTWLRYSCGDVEYIWVEHRQGEPSEVTGEQRRNVHVLSYGSDKLPVLDMRGYWLEHYLSTVSGLKEQKHPRKAVDYLCGYLSGEEKFQRCRMSHGWVFPGWIGVSRAYKQARGQYMCEDDLAWLSTLTPEDRKREIGWALTEGFE